MCLRHVKKLSVRIILLCSLVIMFPFTAHIIKHASGLVKKLSRKMVEYNRVLYSVSDAEKQGLRPRKALDNTINKIIYLCINCKGGDWAGFIALVLCGLMVSSYDSIDSIWRINRFLPDMRQLSTNHHRENLTGTLILTSEPTPSCPANRQPDDLFAIR